MENILVRPLENKDAETITAIYEAITQKPVTQEFTPIIRGHAKDENDACFVAVLDDKVVGFMVSYILTMGFGISKSAWIATLGVDPNHMGQGIGEKLARKVLEFYKSEGIENVYTSVRWDSTDLLSFFKTLGFTRSDFVNLRKILQ